MKYPNFNEEKKLHRLGYKKIVGLDEAGRGPLAGPVIAAAVIIRQISNLKSTISQIKDSKKLTPKKREELYEILTKTRAIKWGTGKTSEKVIDKINIKNAAELAMFRAIQKLKKSPDFLLIDGKYLKNKKLKKIKYKLIIKADEKVLSCAIASIIAKVTRDKIMRRYHKKYPRYGFDKHKGYPTKLHKKMLKKYSPCEIHRKSFRPIKKVNSIYAKKITL